MITYVKIETYRRATDPARIVNSRVVLEGTETVDEVKAKIRETTKITEFHSDELKVNGQVITDTVDFNNFTKVEYKICVVERQEPIVQEVKRPAFQALKSKNYAKAVAYRANVISRSEIMQKLSKKITG